MKQREGVAALGSKNLAKDSGLEHSPESQFSIQSPIV